MVCDAVLTRAGDIRRLYDRGAVLRSQDVVLVYLHTEGDSCRILVVASQKVGRAVQRNRAKRLLREAHRRIRPRGEFAGVDLALIARAGAASISGRAMEEQVASLYSLAHLITERAPDSSGETTNST